MRYNRRLVLSLSILLFLIIGICFFIFIPNISKNANVKIKIEEIKEDYKGVIIDKFSVRDTPPTHLKVRTSIREFQISPNQEIIRNVVIGDSIVKPANENFVFIISRDGTKSKFFYTKISYETRKNDLFPQEWKNKWIESSEWDDE